STEEVGTPLDQFIFSVLFETSKKAEDALKKCNDKIGAALIASSLLKTVSKLTKREAEFDLSANIMTNSSSINAWELAYATHLKTFMGQTCCQTKLKIIWRGRMATFTPWWQIVMALFLPFLVTTITFTISYLLFLWLFSYFVLVELEARVTTIEYVLWGWSFTMLCEELRQLVTSQGRTPLKKIWCWYVSNWNKYDLATFLVGMASILGPKIIMLGKMMIDVLVFVRILLIFVISFGIMYTAILFPNTRPSFLLLKRIFYVPYWQIFGETFLDVLTGDQESCTKKESVADDDTRCPEEHILAPVFGAAYMFLTNIILINLLISMFRQSIQSSNTTPVSVNYD
ncbi:hypothetical protein DPMN_094946, partial [Dreissena polymorpha]